MNYNLTIIKNCGRLICLFLLYLMIFASIITVYEGSILSPVYLSGIPAILLFYLIVERYCYSAFLYILLHLVPFGVVHTVDFPTPYYRFLYYVLLTAECLHSFSVWKSSGEKSYSGTPWGLFVFTAILYIISSSYKMTALSSLIYYCGVGLVMVHFFRLSVEGISSTLSQTQHATSVPTRKMILTSGITTGFTCLFFSIIAIAVRTFGLEEFLYDIGRLIIKINRIIFRFLSYIIAVIRALFSRESHIEDSTAAEEELSEALQAIHEPSLLAKIIDKILIIFALFVMLYLLYRAISYIVHIFFLHYAKDTDQIIRLNNASEKTVKKKESGHLSERLKAFFHTDNRSRIRHLYKMKIKSFNDTIYHRSDTPADIAKKVENIYAEDIRDLTEVYEKARYSNEPITLDDVQKGGCP